MALLDKPRRMGKGELEVKDLKRYTIKDLDIKESNSTISCV